MSQKITICMDRNDAGIAADLLNDTFSFDRKPAEVDRRRDKLRDVYNALREAEKRPNTEPEKTSGR